MAEKTASPEPAEAPGASNAGPSAPGPGAPASHWTQSGYGDGEDEDDEGFDADSALGSDAASTTASLSASILEYRTLHGRTYHSKQGNADHWAPNDEAHQEAMDVVHHTLTLLMDGKIFTAPISDDPKKVLDVGTGTGIWAIDFADAYPNAEVIGTDLSPSQPEWVPPNLKFEIEDCTQPWTFRRETFDFVHMRYLFGSIEDWDALYLEAFRATRPGGWVEAVEASVDLRSDDGSVVPGSALADWGPLFHQASAKFNRSMTVVEDGTVVSGIKNAGFVDVTEKTEKLPATPWARDERLKQVGAYSRLAMEEDLEGYAIYLFTNALGWSREQVMVYLARVRRELKDMNIRPYFMVQYVYGRKPEAV